MWGGEGLFLSPEGDTMRHAAGGNVYSACEENQRENACSLPQKGAIFGRHGRGGDSVKARGKGLASPSLGARESGHRHTAKAGTHYFGKKSHITLQEGGSAQL